MIKLRTLFKKVKACLAKNIVSVVLFLSVAIFTFFSFNESFYTLLVNKTNNYGWSYVLDQLLPLIIGLIVLLAVLKVKLSKIKVIFRSHILSIIILSAVLLLIHGILINTYFYAEDSLYLFSPAVNNTPLIDVIRGYPMATILMSAMLFKTNAYLYNVVALFLFLTSSFLFYWVSYLLTKKKKIALVASLIFVTHPSFLDLFSWQSTIQESAYVFCVLLGSILLFLYYQKTIGRIAPPLLTNPPFIVAIKNKRERI